MILETITVDLSCGNIWMIKLGYLLFYKSIYKNKYKFQEWLFKLIGVIDTTGCIIQMMNQ
jgi:hypothetical protein